MKRVLTVAGLALLQAACQTTAGGGASSLMVPANHRELLALHYRNQLKDPYSVRDAGISHPREEFSGLLRGGMRQGVCVRFNAKNSFGAYIGLRTSFAIFRNGAVEVAIEAPLGCGADVVYEAFLEMERPASINAAEPKVTR